MLFCISNGHFYSFKSLQDLTIFVESLSQWMIDLLQISSDFFDWVLSWFSSCLSGLPFWSTILLWLMSCYIILSSHLLKLKPKHVMTTLLTTIHFIQSNSQRLFLDRHPTWSGCRFSSHPTCWSSSHPLGCSHTGLLAVPKINLALSF